MENRVNSLNFHQTMAPLPLYFAALHQNCRYRIYERFIESNAQNSWMEYLMITLYDYVWCHSLRQVVTDSLI